MHRWFLSYNSQDIALVQAFEEALRQKDAGTHIFFAPRSLRAGSNWLPELSREIAEATVFVLLVGPKGLGDWQVIEYYEAFDKHVKMRDFPLVLVLLDGQPAPGLPFLRQLHWIVTKAPASEETLASLMDAAAGKGSLPRELWRHTAPYRGLAAMTEADTDFFFGRTREAVEVLNVLAAPGGRLPILLGNSGVGKSSLAQAGVLAALARQGWPEQASDAGPWPVPLGNSRSWCFLTIKPGVEPLKGLVDAFLRTWQLDATDPLWARRQSDWIEALIAGKLGLSALLDATERRYEELSRWRPPAFFLYVDQGEELYVRSEQGQARCFSRVLASAIGDPRLRVMMSLRADFLGALQNDEPLYAVHQQINVPPLRETELRDVVMKPALILGARFETDKLADDIARRAAEESVKDAGALPLLSYLLDDMWAEMVRRGDGLLRLPHKAIELGAVLAERANAFIANHPNSADALKRVLTLKLATVREDGEPTRRRARRVEFTDAEWALVSDLADHPHRLLITAKGGDGETYAEVAHEAIFRRWERLREWIAQEREFLIWRAGLESARHSWEKASESVKDEALLMGLPLAQAKNWLTKRAVDIVDADQDYIRRSGKVMGSRKLRVWAWPIAIAVIASAAAFTAWANRAWLDERAYALFSTTVLSTEEERAHKPGESFRECPDCPKMIVIPDGHFMMGSPKGQGNKDEYDQHPVTIARRFAVAETELSFAAWDACVAHGDCSAGIRSGEWGRGEQPTINVGWRDAQRYVDWLRRVTGKDYRLLTEAEWEYAARAGTETDYSFPDGQHRDYTWYDEGNRRPQPVGEEEKKKSNPFGLRDMHGNVAEWVQDCYSDNYDKAPTDGSAWTGGNCARRVIRGGSWRDYLPKLRSAKRDWMTFDKPADTIGIRIGRSLAGED